MKTQHYILGISLLALGLNLPTEAAAQTATVYDSQQSLQNEINKSKSAKERIASNRVRRNHTFSDFGQAYTDFKNRLNKDYGFDYSVDISYMGQRAAPNGKKNSMQTYIYPSITWTTFNNEYGTGTLNAAYTIIRYGGKNGSVSSGSACRTAGEKGFCTLCCTNCVPFQTEYAKLPGCTACIWLSAV